MASLLRVVLAMILLTPLTSFAEEDKPVDKRGGDIVVSKDGQVLETDTHKEGDYGGVVPGKGDAKPARVKKGKKQRAPVVSWVGFQPLEAGSARVFVQLTGAGATYDQAIVGDELVVTIPGVTLNERNNARFLDTSHFETRIARIEARKIKAKGRGKKRTPGGVEVHIKFKQGAPAQADAKVEQGQDGANYIFLDFGP